MSDVESGTHAVAVTINGTAIHLSPPTIAATMVHIGVPMETGHVAVAVNDAVISRAAWASTTLVTGDCIEIITAVAGG